MYIEINSDFNPGAELSKFSVQKDEFLLIFVAESSKEVIPFIVDASNQLNITICGGMFPAIITSDGKKDSGMEVVKFPSTSAPLLIENIASGEFNLPEIQRTIPVNPDIAISLVDGLTSNISNFLYEVYSSYGNQYNFTGGGAGSLSLKQEECLFTNNGFYKDAAIIAFLDRKAIQGVKHGWEKIAGPLIATSTEANVIHEINWSPAGEVYKSIVEEDSESTISIDNFFDVSKNYPFGMYKESSEYIVRDPIVLNEDNSITCVGEVPENSVVDVLKGNSEKLLEAAKESVNDALAEDAKLSEVLIFDCISRVLFLGDDFNKELEAVKDPLSKMNNFNDISGALSLGEISSRGKGQLDFYNKTIVSCLIYEK